ncbi:MAG: histidinol-phosphatase [Clostridia bacterium]|nr:histidinol-phosphatase [Clostridia bacterium]
MTRRDLRMHTCFSDGKNTPEEMVCAAIAAGLEEVGISDHSYTSFDDSYCLGADKLAAYRAENARLREKYRDQIRVLCGIEQDYYSDFPAEGFDYVIGSVHYLKCGEDYISVDLDAETLRTAAEKYFAGDIYALAEEYYRTVGDVVDKTGADIIGHFDLIAKFCEQSPLFDLQHPRYVAAWKAAVDRLLAAGVPFEINFGAMSRGYRTSPYPSAEICDYLRAKGARFVLSSDSHDAAYVGVFPGYK